MSNPHNIKVGDKLWFAPSDRRHPCMELTVMEIGRKWMTMNAEGRFDVETFIGASQRQGYAANGRVWLSKTAHDDHKRRYALWWQITHEGRFRNIPDGVTTAQLESVLTLLGIPLPKEP